MSRTSDITGAVPSPRAPPVSPRKRVGSSLGTLRSLEHMITMTEKVESAENELKHGAECIN